MEETEKLMQRYENVLKKYEASIDEEYECKLSTYGFDSRSHLDTLTCLEGQLGDKLTDLRAKREELTQKAQGLIQRNKGFEFYMVKELFLKNTTFAAQMISMEYLGEISGKEPQNDVEREAKEYSLKVLEEIVSAFKEIMRTYALKAKGKDENYYVIHFLMGIYSQVNEHYQGMHSVAYIAQVIGAAKQAKTPQEKLDKILELTKESQPIVSAGLQS
jgi:hypothetical protein